MSLARRDFLFVTAGVLLLPGLARGADPLWSRLGKGGFVLLIRHASTEPGQGDPPGFRLEDCATQRNLSAQGREEARRLGARVRASRVPIERVYTSPWCRCRETATLAFGRADDWQPLASIFDFPERESDYTERVRKRIASYSRRDLRGNVVMVTHNVNIAALTRESVAPAEIVVVRGEGCCGLRSMGRLRAD